MLNWKNVHKCIHNTWAKVQPVHRDSWLPSYCNGARQILWMDEMGEQKGRGKTWFSKKGGKPNHITASTNSNASIQYEPVAYALMNRLAHDRDELLHWSAVGFAVFPHGVDR